MTMTRSNPPKVRRYRDKKQRGWRWKRFFAIKISQITETGFLLHNDGRDYYVSRKKYPWFLDATDNEIRDVRKVRDMIGDDHGDMFVWDSLDIELETKKFDYPDSFQVYGVYVRGQNRPDLFAKSDYVGDAGSGVK